MTLPNTRYLVALDQIFHTSWAIPRLVRLERLRTVIQNLWPGGHPTRSVQVGGTSGKTSTTRLLAAALGAHKPSGALTSPHVFDWRERFTLRDTHPSQEAIADVWDTILRPLCVGLFEHESEALGFGAINLLMALVLFERNHLHWGAIEVGVGGLYDATSALDSPVSVVTNVGADHEHRLGSEPWQRALEKVSVARPGGALFTGSRDPEILEWMRAICRDRGATLHVVGDDATARLRGLLAQTPSDNPDDALLGASHQQQNAALALAVARHMAPTLNEAAAVAAMRRVRLPGRLTRIDDDLYVDLAHNPNKTHALADDIRARLSDRPLHLVVGVSGKRDAQAVLTPLLPLAASVTLTRAGFKGQPPEAIAAALDLDPAPARLERPHEAVEHARERAAQDQGVVLVTGSTFVIDQALNPDPYIRHINGTFGWRNRKPNA